MSAAGLASLTHNSAAEAFPLADSNCTQPITGFSLEGSANWDLTESGAGGQQFDDIAKAAMLDWNAVTSRGASPLLNFHETSSGNRWNLRWEDLGAEGPRAERACDPLFNVHEITINSNADYVSTDPSDLGHYVGNPGFLRSVIRHEAGHAAGLAHSGLHDDAMSTWATPPAMSTCNSISESVASAITSDDAQSLTRRHEGHHDFQRFEVSANGGLEDGDARHWKSPGASFSAVGSSVLASYQGDHHGWLTAGANGSIVQTANHATPPETGSYLRAYGQVSHTEIGASGSVRIGLLVRGIAYPTSAPSGTSPACQDLATQWVTENWQNSWTAFGEMIEVGSVSITPNLEPGAWFGNATSEEYVDEDWRGYLAQISITSTVHDSSGVRPVALDNVGIGWCPDEGNCTNFG